MDILAAICPQGMHNCLKKKGEMMGFGTKLKHLVSGRARFRVAAVLLMLAGSAQAAEYDLVLNHTDSPDPAIAGANVTYTLRVTNDSFANAVTNIRLTDTLPVAGSPSASYKVGTYVSATASQGACATNVGNTVVTCDLGTLAPQAEATVVVVVRSTAQGIMRNTASVTSTTPGFVDPNAGNSSNFQDTTVKQGADVHVVAAGPVNYLSVAPVGAVASGSALAYSLQVHNAGPDVASGVRAVFNLPVGFTTTGALPAGCTQALQQVTCDIPGSIAVAGSYTITPINGVVTASAGSTLTNSASVSIVDAAAPQDPDLSNNLSTVNTSVNAGSDVGIAVSQSRANNVLTGDTFNYTFTTSYSGEDPTNLVVSHTLPGNYTITSAPVGTGWDCSASAGQTVSCSRATGGLGAGYNMTLPAITVGVQVAGLGNNTSAATVTSTEDPHPPGAGVKANSVNANTVVVAATYDLTASKESLRADGSAFAPAPYMVVVANSFRWRLRLTNNGPSAVNNTVTMTDTLPTGVTLTAYAATNGWNCAPAPGALPLVGDGATSTVTCTFAYTVGSPLASGASTPYVELTVLATAAGALNNQVCGSAAGVTDAAGGGIGDSNTGPGNDCAASPTVTAQTPAGGGGQAVDIAVNKSVQSWVAPNDNAGDLLVYRIEVANLDTNAHDATLVTLTDNLSNLINSASGAGQGYESYSASVPGGGTSSVPTCATAVVDATTVRLTCDFGTVKPCTSGNDCPYVDVSIRPNGAHTGNSATAFSSNVVDPNQGNNTGSATVTVVQRTNITATITDNPDPARVGGYIDYVVTAINNGVSDAAAVTSTVILPDGVVIVSTDGCTGLAVGATTTAGAHTLTCAHGAIVKPSPASQTTSPKTIRVRPTLAVGTPLPFTVTASVVVSTTTPETSTADNGTAPLIATTTQVDAPQQDLQVQIDDLKDPVAVGYNVTYRITAINNGPSFASNVRVSHVLPGSNIVFVSATPSSGSCVGGTVGAAGGTVVCSVGGLASGGSATIDVVVQGTAIAVVNNTVSVTSDELDAGVNYDPLTGNNSDMEDTTFKQPADLSLTKTANRMSANVGDAVKFTLTIRNDGPGNVTDVTVKDYLPAGFTYVSNAPSQGSYASGTGVWSVGNLNNGQSATLELNVTVTATAAYTNYAQITASSLPDPDSTPNNRPAGPPVEDDEAQATVTVPAGPAGDISGKVYLDADDDGVADPGEGGIAGVTVTLIRESDSATVATAVTDAAGAYLFGGVPSGVAYTIRETHPVAWQDGRETVGTGAIAAAGTAANAGFDATAANNRITGVTLNGGDVAINYNFGERSFGSGGLASVSGRAWYNTRTIDKRQESGEPAASSFVVELVRNGAVVASTTTDANGAYRFANVTPGDGYEIRFRAPHANANTGDHPIYSEPISQDPGYNASTPDYSNHTIANLVLRAGVELTEQNLPIDPSGIIYDAVTRQPVSGATVTILGPAGFNPAVHLVGGLANVNQVTDASGFYQFLLFATAPAGDYTLQVSHSSYVATPSLLIPPCSGSLVVGALPNPANIQANAYAPPIGTTDHRTQPGACAANSSGLTPLNQATTQYYFTFTLSGASGNVLNNHIPLDPAPLGAGPLIVLKSTPLINVTRGDLVPYTVTAININAVAQNNLVVRDFVPPGFKYKVGSATVDGVHLEPTVNGRELTWTGQNFAAANTSGSRHVYRLILVVGSGVGEGEYVNTARATTAVGASVSNTATATVRIVPDPTFDCSDLIGKVFDDQNANGWQDEGEPGIANVRVATARGLLVTTDKEGRFHVACAAIPQAQRGSNFFMKLDERSLPSGYRLTTENPREVRATRGKLVKLNFGAAIHRVVRLELSDTAFLAGKPDPAAALASTLDKLPETLRVKPSVVRLAYQAGKEDGALASARLRAVRERLEELWKARGCCYTLVFEEEIFERASAKKGGAK